MSADGENREKKTEETGETCSCYILLKVLQKGKDGTVVYLGEHKESKKQVAIKKIRDPSPQDVKSKKSNDFLLGVQREIAMHKLVYSSIPEASKLYDVVYTRNYVYLILEYCEGEDLLEHLRTYSSNPSRWNSHSMSYRLSVFIELVRISIKLLSFGILHHDIKPDNFILSNSRVRILDWGCGEWTPHPESSRSATQGTMDIRPPETLDEQFRSFRDAAKSYSWTLGILLFILTSLYPSYPFDDPSQKISLLSTQRRIRENKRREFNVWVRLYENEIDNKLTNYEQWIHAILLNDLLLKLLEPNPRRRLHPNQILLHPACHLCLFQNSQYKDHLGFTSSLLTTLSQIIKVKQITYEKYTEFVFTFGHRSANQREIFYTSHICDKMRRFCSFSSGDLEQKIAKSILIKEFPFDTEFTMQHICPKILKLLLRLNDWTAGEKQKMKYWILEGAHSKGKDLVSYRCYQIYRWIQYGRVERRKDVRKLKSLNLVLEPRPLTLEESNKS